MHSLQLKRPRNKCALKLLVGIILSGAGLAAAIETNTDLRSLSWLLLGFGGVSGVFLIALDQSKPLRRVVDRIQWLIVGILILLLFIISQYEPERYLIGYVLGFSTGILVGTIGEVLGRTVSN